MKKQIYLGIILLVMTLPFVSCKKVPEEFTFPGKWYISTTIVDTAYGLTVMFFNNDEIWGRDGTGEFGPIGSYTLNGDQITFTITVSDETDGRIEKTYIGNLNKEELPFIMKGSVTFKYIDLENQGSSGTWEALKYSDPS